ncbi:MAG: recombinase family protein, partial [Puniceicoccales bacterium]|nr:recombinase family protein [Puniceicoccales bacterium]
VMELNADGSKTRQGIPWMVPRVKYMLGNYHYIGKVNYNGNVVEGEQDAIIDQELWDQVQEFRCENKQTNDRYTRMETVAPLKGVLRCGHCNCAMAPTYTKKHGRRYFYYKCQKDSERGISICPVKSISAGEIEHLIYDQLVKIMQTPEVLVALEQHSGMEAKAILAQFDGEIWMAMNNGEKRRLIELLVEKAEVREDGLTIEIRTEGIKSLQAEYIYKDKSYAFAPKLEIKVTVLPNGNVSIFIPLIFRKHSQRRKIIVNGGIRDSADLDPLLVSIARGRRWQRMIDDGIFVNCCELAKAVGRDPSQVASNLRTAMLAPDIVHQIIAGNAPKTLTSQTMRREIPELWTDQMETFLGKRETPSTRSTSIPLTRETRAVGTAVCDRAGFTSNGQHDAP